MTTYNILLSFHLIAVISWMAGMLYLPRLFVYHAGSTTGSEQSETFKIMESKLLRIIMNPAMILTFVLGIVLVVQNPGLLKSGWIHAKFFLVFLMAGCHGYLAVCRKKFAKDANTKSPKFYKIINEVPTALMVFIIILAITKPF